MSDQPPRVRVTLPGDAPARLLRWRQDDQGRWWAEVTTYVPAGAVRQVDGEDYDQVPREPATLPEQQYVLNTLPAGQRILHVLNNTCFAVDEKQRPACDADRALDLLAEGAEPCGICQPAP